MVLLPVGFGDRLRRGEVLFGPLVQISSPALMEVLGLAGFDFVVLDREHGALSVMDIELLARACASTGLTPLVRLRSPVAAEISAVLDTGVAGVHVPRVESPETAVAVVKAARFFPAGHRGLNPFVRAASYSHDSVAEFVTKSNQEVVVVICVEGSVALTRLDEILAVEGIDVIFLGPYDISHALGIPGEVTHPRVIEAVGGAMSRVVGHGLVAGVFTSTVEGARLWAERGAQYIVFSVDTRLYLESGKLTVQELRALKGEARSRGVKKTSVST
jgi:4-hydroxy-2-oxoheptanedioate aldolase